MENSKSIVLCQDCKYAFRTWYDILLGAPKRHSLRCRKAYRPTTEEVDYVTGPKMKKEHFETCGMARLNAGPCGNDGKLWEPKDPKKFFVYLKRV